MTESPKDPISPPRHKLRGSHWRMGTQALEQIFGGEPADAVLRAQFRKAPQCGSRDRANVTRLVYGVLREQRALEARVGARADALAAAFALRAGEADVCTLAGFGVADAEALAARLADTAPLTLAQQLNVPDEAWSRWTASLGDAAAAALAGALNREASVDLRVNTTRATREEARQTLAQDGIEAVITALSPWGLRLAQRLNLQSTRAFRDGWIEPQDEGSQLLALLTGAAPGETVADYCAGAGGKTLALGAMMEGRGRLVALDVDARRLQRMAPRLERAGLAIVETGIAGRDDAEVAGRCEVVLVDAPCSASGTWRRNPELRLRPLELARRHDEQRSILRAASALVRGGGRLVYATCSLFREENEDVVEAFLAESAGFRREDIELPGLARAPYLRLFPHVHGTDGFFGALLRRDR